MTYIAAAEKAIMNKQTILRVTQMNSIYFDQEIKKLFTESMQYCWEHLQPHGLVLYHNELNLLIKSIILWYSVLKHHGTFGQQLLSMKYNNITSLKKILLCAGVLIEYLMDKSQDSDNNILAKFKLTKFKDIVQIFKFLNISLFLRSGLKPRLVERILGLEISYSSDNIQRQYSSLYMTRELLWDSFIEILIYILPLINYQKVKRTVKHLNPLYKKLVVSAGTAPEMTISTKCAYCNEFPILPHYMGCPHIFCYTCLKGNQMADMKYECPKCDYNGENTMCERVT